MFKSFIRSGLQLAALAATLPAIAQEPVIAAQRIEVSAVRHDVRTLCAGIDDELPRQLARSLRMLQDGALVEVQFRIDGHRIDEVTTRGGSFDTRAATRRAVRGLDCDNGSAGRQTVRFEVLFNLDDDGPAGSGPMAAGRPSVLAQSGQAAAAK